MFLAGNSGSFLQKQILKVQWLSQPCLGNTNVVPCWLVQHHWLLGFFRETSTVTDNHSSRWRQQTVCFMSLLKHLGRSGICSASRKCPVPQKCPPLSSHMIQIPNICNSRCGYYYYFPLRTVKDGLSTSLLFLSASLSTHGWLHASKRRVVVLLVVGGEDRNRGALLERAGFQWAGKHVGFSLNSFSVNRRLRTIFISGA